MNFSQDFATVDLILESDFVTRGVDSFVLSLIKAEKQLRRIFTYLIFQNTAFTHLDYFDLRTTLANNRKLYFESFIKGINIISPRPIKDIYGEDYETDLNSLLLFTNDRNKIFHGQITQDGLSRQDLLNRVEIIKKWCKTLGNNFLLDIDFDGFSDSYRKSKLNFTLNFDEMFNTIEKYDQFLKVNMNR